MDDRLPPHNLEAEAAVIATVIIAGDGRELDKVITKLEPDDFYSGAHRDIWAHVCKLHNAGKPTDLVVVAESLRSEGRLEKVGGLAYLTELLNATPSVARIETYAQIVVEASKVRACIAACQRIVAEGYASVKDVPEYLSRAEHALQTINTNKGDAQFERVSQSAARVDVGIRKQAADNSKMSGLPTGYVELDRKLNGLRPKTLTIIAARPAVGKSALALNIAWHTASVPGQHVAFFSLEMSNDELTIRGVSGLGRIDQTRIHGVRLTADDWTRWTSSVAASRDVNLHLCDDASMTVFGIRSMCRRLQSALSRSGQVLALVVVDYLQLMEHPSRKRNDNREQEVSQISRALKRLAGELQCPVIALSQLNRAVESRGGEAARPRLSDLRESGAIEQDANNVIFVHRVPRKGETKDNLHEIIIAKARSGKPGVVQMHFEGRFTRFDELSTQEAAE